MHNKESRRRYPVVVVSTELDSSLIVPEIGQLAPTPSRTRKNHGSVALPRSPQKGAAVASPTWTSLHPPIRDLPFSRWELTSFGSGRRVHV